MDYHASNQEVGSLVGLDHSTISRLRAGQRLPGLDTMLAFSQILGWPLIKQVEARSAGVEAYAQRLEAEIIRYFQRSPVDKR